MRQLLKNANKISLKVCNFEYIMYTINKIADYVIFRLKKEDNGSLVNLKLQKLMYYIQAWYIAFNRVPLFDGKFQAWIHGPVNRELYDRFKDKKSLYSDIDSEDIISEDFDDLSASDKAHIDGVLETYAQFSGYQLETMTHSEDPWILARKGFLPIQRCEHEISEEMMGEFYRKRLQK